MTTNFIASTLLAPSLQSAPPCGHWLSVVTHLDPRYGGLSTVVPQLASMVSATGRCNVSLAAFCTENERSSISDGLDLARWPAGRGAWFRDRTLTQRFDQQLEDVDGVHIHGLWEQSTLVAARAARARKLPYVLSAHGMLEPWALANKRLKKIVYSALIERANVRGATCLHALTRAEAEDYRRYGADRPVAIIPNGVDIPSHLSPQLFLARYPELRGKRIVIFLGRLHFKKGLDLLVQAWKRAASRYSDAHLVLAGPDCEGTQSKIESVIAQEEISNSVLFTGMLRDDLKWSALAAAECFVLSSYSEGLSVSTLEAMAAGLPVIISDHCNLPEVTERGAGWIIPAEVLPLQRALEDLFSNSLQTNSSIGACGRELVRGRYDWAMLAQQMSDVYAWTQGGEVPTTVEILNAGGRR